MTTRYNLWVGMDRATAGVWGRMPPRVWNVRVGSGGGVVYGVGIVRGWHIGWEYFVFGFRVAGAR